MISLRQFACEDARCICDRIYPDMELDQAIALIEEWSTLRYEGKCFLMNGIWAEGELVGTISLLEVDHDTASFGIEIVSEFRKKGFAYEAGMLWMERAENMGFRTLMSQVRQDNDASIALHRKLGFKQYGSGVNRRGRQVFLYKKDLSTAGKLPVSLSKLPGGLPF